MPPALAVRTYDELRRDGDEGSLLFGDYRIPRPICLNADRPALVAHPSRRARITAPGCGILAAFAEPAPPAEMWRADGGLRLGSRWKLAFPSGCFSYPGLAPKFWAGLDRWELALDCAMDSWTGAFTLCAIAGRDGLCPVRLMAVSGLAVVDLVDAEGKLKRYKARLPRSASGDRVRVGVRLEGGAVLIGFDGGTPAKVGEYVPPLAPNVDGCWQVNSSSAEPFGPEVAAAGGMTLYGMRMGWSVGTWVESYNLELPAPGDWWCPPDGLLLDGSEARRSMESPMVRVEGVDVHSTWKTGANVLLGKTQHGARLSDVNLFTGRVGLGMLSACYPVELHGVSMNRCPFAGIVADTPELWARQLYVDRCGSYGIVQRGGLVSVDGGQMGPGPNAIASAWVKGNADQTVFALGGRYIINDEGAGPSDAHFVCDASPAWRENGLVVTLSDLTIGHGERVARLVGKNGSLTYARVTSDTDAPWTNRVATADGPGWSVEGVPRGRRAAFPVAAGA